MAARFSTPARAPWFAMVKKHHAWKTAGLDSCIYGEDIYGVHSIGYDPVSEDRTFYAFGLRLGDVFESFAALEGLACELNIPVVPVLWRGRLSSVEQADRLIAGAHAGPSCLGGEREGVVMRLAGGVQGRRVRVLGGEERSRRTRPDRRALESKLAGVPASGAGGLTPCEGVRYRRRAAHITPQFDHASMRPHLFRRGNVPMPYIREQVTLASMRPRPFRWGNRPRIPRRRS